MLQVKALLLDELRERTSKKRREYPVDVSAEILTEAVGRIAALCDA